MNRRLLPRDETTVGRDALARDRTVITVGVPYYGVVLPPEVEAKMDQVNTAIDALNVDVMASLTKKYGKTADGKWAKPLEAADDQRLLNWRDWGTAAKQYFVDYKSANVAWKWVASNSLGAYKHTEALEGDILKWRDEWTKVGATITAPKPTDIVKPDIDVGAIGDAIKYAVIGVGLYVGYEVFKEFTAYRKEKKEAPPPPAPTMPAPAASNA